MEISEHSVSFDPRVIKQLHSLSQLSETLTLRVLEIEEKLRMLENAKSSPEDSLSDYSQQLLKDSEEKMQQISSLLDLQDSQDSTLSNVIEMENKENTPENDFLAQTEEKCKNIQDSSEDQDCVGQENEVLYTETIDTEYVDDPQIPLISA